MNEFVDGEVACHGSQESFDSCFVTIDIEQSTDNLGGPDRIDTLHINFDELREAVLIEIKNEIMDKVEAVADDDKGKLILKLCFLQEILDLLWIVMVAFPTDTLNFTNLAGPSGSLDILKVHFWIFAEVHNRPKVVVETLEEFSFAKGYTWQRYSPSNVLKDSNISINLTGPRISEYFVAIWMTTWRFCRIFTLSISCMHAIDCSVVRRLK